VSYPSENLSGRLDTWRVISVAKIQAKTKKSAPKHAAKPARPKAARKAASKAAVKAKRSARPAPKTKAKAAVKTKARPAAAKPAKRATKAIAKPAPKTRPTSAPNRAPVKLMPQAPVPRPMPPRSMIPKPVVVKPAPPSLPPRPVPPKAGPKPTVVKVAPMKPIPVAKVVLPSQKEYAEMRTRLEHKRQEILESYKRDLRVGQESNDEPTEDIVDRANNAYHRELMFSLSDSERQLLLQIEAALSRFELGTFGACVHCGDPIALPRLQAIPWARLCINCQELAEKGLLDDN